VYHFAKQHNLPFNHSYTRVEQSFDLIHIDIKGPNVDMTMSKGKDPLKGLRGPIKKAR